MRSFKIEDTKSFMSALLLHDAFYGFELAEGEIVTFISCRIDGRYRREYFDDTSSAEAENLLSAGLFTPWKLMQPHVYGMVRGRHTPLKLHLVLRLSDRQSSDFISSFSIDPEALSGLYLNILYDHSSVSLTSGISLKIFTTDKAAEHAWDDRVEMLLRDTKLPFSLL